MPKKTDRMHVIDTILPDLKLIQQFRADDARGHFVKTFQQNQWEAAGLTFTMRESFYSVSHQGVIRGLHFQHPPHDHAKIVFCTSGAILDVALDIRKQSPTYGRYFSAVLSAENNQAMFIPSGFAHGFKTLRPETTTFYFVSSENHRPADDGILYNSIGLDWELEHPIVSERDLAFVAFNQFQSPF